MEIQGLTRWLIRKKCFVKKEEKHLFPNTHYLLNGGILHIPTGLLNEFHHEYAKAMNNNEEHYLCETKTKVFKLIADLDFKEEKEVEIERILEYCKVIQRVIQEFYSQLNDHSLFKDKENYKRVIICTGKSKQDKDKIKTGIHLIWPEIPIDKKLVFILREAIIQALEKEFGKRDSEDPWSLVLDKTVYNKNGLRMIGSKKCKRCNSCKNDKRRKGSCKTCNGAGNIKENRFYSVSYIMSENGELMTNNLKNDWYKAVKETSIVTKYKAVSYSFEIYPKWFVKDKEESECIKEKRKYTKKKIEKFDDSDKVLDKVGKQRILVRSENKINELNFFIKKYLPKEFNGISVVDLFSCDSGQYYLARVSSNYCINKGSEHNSNGIYFYINKAGLHQKCFCTCDIIRTYGKCKEFIIKLADLSEVLKYTLYPEEKLKALQLRNEILPVNDNPNIKLKRRIKMSLAYLKKELEKESS